MSEQRLSGNEPIADAPRANVRRWSSSGGTRRAILDAAKELFGSIGYERTSINDLVTRSGVSVGSIYHHLGGKDEVFKAVAAEVMDEQAKASRDAISALRESGESGTLNLYLAGARAYTIACWENRGVSGIMLGDDRPSGFEENQRKLVARMMAGTRNLRIGEPPMPDSSSRIIIAILRTAAEQVVLVDDLGLASEIADYYIGVLRKLLAE